MKTITVMRGERPATAEELHCAVEGKPLPPLAGYAAKPPRGVIPRQLWLEKRAQDLARAIHEYTTEGRYEPVSEWLTELHELWPHISALSQGGPARDDCKQEPNPPLAPANG